MDECQYPDITIILLDGTAFAYHIFAVRESDIYDPTYRSEFQDAANLAAFTRAEGAARLLTLSTCTDSGDRDTRLCCCHN